MITVGLLSCFTIIVSAAPVTQRAQPGEATNQNPELQTQVPLSPRVVQPQAGVLQQGGPQPLPSLQHYTWPPFGSSLMIVPLQSRVHGSQHVNQPAVPQQPLVVPPYGYFPLFSSPYTNQLNPQILYMLQQPMSSTLGSVSSEELQMAAGVGQLGMYVPTVLTNLPTGGGRGGGGGVQPVSQASGLKNQAEAVPTVVTPSAGVPQAEGWASTGPQPDTNVLPVGLEQAAQEVATVQPSAQLSPQPTQGNLV
ncbi:hypothetical protein INR49_025769 [Caranx melampygus]|nr:hypothetical protein INR49_025769 [Caranx melampygus]